VLPDALAHPPETICHKRGCSDEVGGRPEAANGQIALVLDGIIAASRRHILRHGGRSSSGRNRALMRVVDAET
jgi:hypothetical protein